MRSKLASQMQTPAVGPVTSSADMLQRTRRMFTASRQQVQAASHELQSLQQFIRFRASREDVAWAAAGTHLEHLGLYEPAGLLQQSTLDTQHFSCHVLSAKLARACCKIILCQFPLLCS